MSGWRRDLRAAKRAGREGSEPVNISYDQRRQGCHDKNTYYFAGTKATKA
ncbi:hypothetical protein EMIT079MI2_110009 [Bacillus sp. IT-79MI2]